MSKAYQQNFYDQNRRLPYIVTDEFREAEKKRNWRLASERMAKLSLEEVSQLKTAMPSPTWSDELVLALMKVLPAEDLLSLIVEQEAMTSNFAMIY